MSVLVLVLVLFLPFLLLGILPVVVLSELTVGVVFLVFGLGLPVLGPS